jgi:hypothetical protein
MSRATRAVILISGTAFVVIAVALPILALMVSYDPGFNDTPETVGVVYWGQVAKYSIPFLALGILSLMVGIRGSRE